MVQPGEDVTWRWSIKPGSAGRHRLSVTLVLRWYGEDDPQIVLREEQVLNRALEIRVSSFLGLGRTPAFLTGLAGLLLGSGMMLGTVFMRRSELPRMQIREPNPGWRLSLLQASSCPRTRPSCCVLCSSAMPA